MTPEIDATRVKTNFLKIGHISSVKYGIFAASTISGKPTVSDLTLLELELEIRHAHPDFLITYYSKRLYCFLFTHIGEDYLNVLDPYNLELKVSGVISAEIIANPSKATTAGADEYSNESEANLKFVPYLALTFIKAVKKLVLFRLSRFRAVQLFGNYALISNQSSDFSAISHIVHIDPILLPLGDLLINTYERNTLSLYDPSVMYDCKNGGSIDDQSTVIYIIPSGIRCHFFDPEDPTNCFSTKPPKNAASILHLIKLSTGIDLDMSTLAKPSATPTSGNSCPGLWVKLVPNLQHLNNQTSNLAKFIHPVENKKFIMWPWLLCVLQFGYTELPTSPVCVDQTSNQKPAFVDPLDVLLSYMDHNISDGANELNFPIGSGPIHQQLSPAGQVLGAPSFGSIANTMNAFENNDESVNNELNVNFNENAEFPVPDPDKKSTGPDLSTEFHLKAENKEGEEVEKEDDNGEDEKVEKTEEAAHVSEDLDDLFGGATDDEDNKSDVAEDATTTSKSPHQIHEPTDIDGDLDKENTEPNSEYASTNTFVNNDSIPLETSDEKQQQFQFSYIDIPKDQMTITKNLGKIKSIPSYSDPGAPPPIMPTPSFPNSFGSNQVNSTTSSQEAEDGSIFLPLLFNPIIKSNIDTKYGKGGKFYVTKEPLSLDRKFVRATSVTEYDTTEKDLATMSRLRHASEALDEDAIEDMDEDLAEEESDVDDIDEVIPKSPPLQLNTLQSNYGKLVSIDQEEVPGGSFGNKKLDPYNDFMNSGANPHISSWNGVQLNSAGELSSPTSGSVGLFATHGKFESPFSSGHGITSEKALGSISPVEEYSDSDSDNSDNIDVGILQNSNVNDNFAHVDGRDKIDSTTSSREQTDNEAKDLITKEIKESSSTGQIDESATPTSVSESSNFLPLILRCVNVQSFPDIFLLNNIKSSEIQSSENFKMDVDNIEDEDNGWNQDFENDQEEEIHLDNRGMKLRVDHVNDILPSLCMFLIYDHGLNQIDHKLSLKTPERAASVPEFSVNGESVVLEAKFKELFPLSYKVSLDEFTDEKFIEAEVSVSGKETDGGVIENQLNFLDDISNDELLNVGSSFQKFRKIEWDSIYFNEEKNSTAFTEYVESLEKFHSSVRSSSSNESELDSIYQLTSAKARVIKQNNIILNLNTLGLNFWRYLNLHPLSGPKNFQMLLITEDCNNAPGYHKFLDSLSWSYKSCNFGNISLVNLGIPETNTTSDVLVNGLIAIHSSREYYRRVNKRLSLFAEQIRRDLMNKTNRFEFDRPLLIMFVNHDESINSLLRISKLIRNFKKSLHRHQVPLVEVFSYVIPRSYLMKENVSNSKYSLRYLSNYATCKIAMNLFNNCPDMNALMQRKVQLVKNKSNFTQLVKEPPHAGDFKFFNGVNNRSLSLINDSSGKDVNGGTSYNGQVFLHLAYERSIDKNWLSAAWSDPLGKTTYTKSWYCLPSVGRNRKDIVVDMNQICEDIWDISNELFKKLSEDIVREMSGFGGKKFLILTRINSIIPDDELVYWKRLSVRNKDVSLIVLSVNDRPKILFEAEGDAQSRGDDNGKVSNNDYMKTLNALISDSESVTSPNFGVSASPFNVGSMNTNSPQQFGNVGGGFLSPQDILPGEIRANQSVTSHGTNNHYGLGSGGSPLGKTSTGTSQSLGTPNEDGFNANGANKSNATVTVQGFSNPQDHTLVDSREKILAILPSVALPSFNSPTRLGMKIGYLAKRYQIPGSSKVQFLVYELNLLSCSNYWKLDSIMRIILNQFKNLISLNSILGIRLTNTGELNTKNSQPEIQSVVESLIPWHVAAVTKTLDYLVHIEVE